MRNLSPFGTCRSCGAQIMWSRTKAGKNMPADPAMIPYRKPKDSEKGEVMLVTQNGEVVPAIRTESAEDETEGVGYISHFATCPNAIRHRKKIKKTDIKDSAEGS